MIFLIISSLVLFVFVVFLSGFVNNLTIKNSESYFLRSRKLSIDRWSKNRKPIFGGISFYISFLVAIILMLVLKTNVYNVDVSLVLLISFVVSLGFFTGFIDDTFNTVPSLKFILQILCGIILAASGVQIQLFSFELLNFLFTVFWVVAIMNAINLLDNMDGIATIVSIFIFATLLLISLYFQSVTLTYTFILIAALASLVCFLKFNVYPSKMFMGDTGSMFLGLLLAIISILFVWNFQINSITQVPVIVKFLSVVSIFILPITDTTTVFFKRIFIFKKSPFIGGRDHTTHHLSYLGFSDKQVFIIFTLISVLYSFVGFVILFLADNWNLYLSIIAILLNLIVFISLFYITHLNLDKNETK